MGHNGYANAHPIYRSGPYNMGEMMSDFDEFETLGPLPPMDDGNQELLSESPPTPFNDQRLFITDMTPDDQN
jgi:hypothetical protein